MYTKIFKNLKSINLQALKFCSPSYRYISAITKETLHEKDEIKSALEIEANLFESSMVNSNPVSESHIKNESQVSQKLTVAPKPLKKNTKTTPLKPTIPNVITNEVLGLQIIRLDNKSINSSIENLLTKIRSVKRNERQYIIVEGQRLILDALQCGLQLHKLFFSQTKQLEKIKTQIASAQNGGAAKIYKIPHHVLKTFSTVATPPGLSAIFHQPLAGVLNEEDLMPISVICDNVRNPNNLGSIIRTCAAIPCYQTIVTKGCCDPWDSKSLRSGCGGQFRINIRDSVEWPSIQDWLPEEIQNCKIFIAESKKNKVLDCPTIYKPDLALNDLNTHTILIIGGEAHGVSEKAYKFLKDVNCVGKLLHIPLAEGTDSINVNSAAAMILFEIRKHFYIPSLTIET